MGSFCFSQAGVDRTLKENPDSRLIHNLISLKGWLKRWFYISMTFKVEHTSNFGHLKIVGRQNQCTSYQMLALMNVLKKGMTLEYRIQKLSINLSG